MLRPSTVSSRRWPYRPGRPAGRWCRSTPPPGRPGTSGTGNPAVRASRRVRHPAQGSRVVAVFPGVGVAGGAAGHDGGTARALCPLLFDSPSHRRFRRAARGHDRVRRRLGRCGLPQGGPTGDGEGRRFVTPPCLRQEHRAQAGAAGSGVAQGWGLVVLPRSPRCLGHQPGMERPPRGGRRAAADAAVLGRVHDRRAGQARGPQAQALRSVSVRLGAQPGTGARGGVGRRGTPGRRTRRAPRCDVLPLHVHV